MQYSLLTKQGQPSTVRTRHEAMETRAAAPGCRELHLLKAVAAAELRRAAEGLRSNSLHLKELEVQPCKVHMPELALEVSVSQHNPD